MTCLVTVPAGAFDPLKDTLSDGLAFNVGIAPLTQGVRDELRIWFLPTNLPGASGFAGYVIRAEASCDADRRPTNLGRGRAIAIRPKILLGGARFWICCLG